MTLTAPAQSGGPANGNFTFSAGYSTSLSFVSPDPQRVDFVGISGTTSLPATVAVDGPTVTLTAPISTSMVVEYTSQIANQAITGASNYTIVGTIQLETVAGCSGGCGVNGRCAPLQGGGVGCQCECGWTGTTCSVPSGFCPKYSNEGAVAATCPVPTPAPAAAPAAPCAAQGAAACTSWQTWNSTTGTCQCLPGWGGPACDACEADSSCAAYYSALPLGQNAGAATCSNAQVYSSNTVFKAYTCDLAGTGLEDILEPGTFSVACNTTTMSGSSSGSGGEVNVNVADGSYCEVEFAMKGKKDNPVSCRSSLCSFQANQTKVSCQSTSCACSYDCPDLDGPFSDIQGKPAIIDCNAAGNCTFDIQDFFIKLEAPCTNQECQLQGYILTEGAYTYSPNSDLNPFLAAIPLIALVAVAAGLGAYVVWHRHFFRAPKGAAAAAAAAAAVKNSANGDLPAAAPPAPQTVHELAFTDVTSVAPARGGGVKTILSHVSGVAVRGELVGILGPSGSGKTSLLSVLAGSVDDMGRSVTVRGAVTLDGAPLDAGTARRVAYCAQDTTLLPTLTVEECVRYSALLRLPGSTPAAEVHAVTGAVLKELGLERVSNSLVGGGSGLRGVSGGERRRVTIAMELVTNPAVLILDEPTSGLDSFSALNMMSTLKTVAGSGRIVMLSFHQPSPAMFNLLDRVYLLVQGRCMFHGPPAAVEDHFARLGLPCPTGTGVAEHMLRCGCDPELLPILLAASDAAAPGEGKAATLMDSASTSEDAEVGAQAPADAAGVNGGKESPAPGAAVIAASHPPPRCSLWRELGVMFWRTGLDILRNPSLLLLHWLMALGMGIFVGCVFYKVGLDISGAQDRAGGIIFALAFFAFSSLTTVDLLIHERRLVAREVRGGYYRPGSYLFSKAVLDALLLRFIPVCLYTAPFYPMMGLQSGSINVGLFITTLGTFAVAVGALSLALSVGCRTAGEASLAMNLVLLVSLLNSGFFVNVATMPDWISWLHYLSVFYYSYATLITNEMATLLLNFVVSIAATERGLRRETF